MKTKSILFSGVMAASLLLLPLMQVQAQPAPRLITADEVGNGTLRIAADNIVNMPGVLTSEGLWYNMLNPPGLIPGDVILLEGPNGPVSDVIRFGSQSAVAQVLGFWFYSDNSDGIDSPADTVGLPATLLSNTATLVEGSLYTPTPNQPGFVDGFAVSYNFNSDVERVPDGGATMGLLGIGLLAIGTTVRKLRM